MRAFIRALFSDNPFVAFAARLAYLVAFSVGFLLAFGFAVSRP